MGWIAEGGVEAGEVADVLAVDKEIEVAAQVTLGVEEVKAHLRVALRDSLNRLADSGSVHGQLALVVHVVFHRGRET